MSFRRTSIGSYQTLPYEEIPKDVPKILKSGVQASWISKFFVKPNKIVLKRLDLEEPEMIQFQDKVEANLLEQKVKQKAMQV